MNQIYKKHRCYVLLLLILAVFCSTTVLAKPQFGVTDLGQQLIRHYPLNGNAIDMSTVEAHGSVNGASSDVDFRNLPDAALTFDGVNDMVQLPFIGNWGAELTISFWVYLDSTNNSSSQVFIGSRNPGNSSTHINFYVSVNDQRKMVWTIASDTWPSTLQSSKSFPMDQWVHVVVDWSSNSELMSIFWNGDLIDSSAIGSGEPRYLNANIGLGRFCQGCGNTNSYLSGKMDEVRFYDRVLSKSEISELSGKTRVYHFTGNTDDESGNDEHADNNGAVLTHDVYGNLDSAYDFDNESDIINVPSIGNWGEEVGFSFSVKPSSGLMPTDHILVGSRKSGSGSTLSNFKIQMNADKSLTWLISSAGSESILSTPPNAVLFDQWSQLIFDWSQLTGEMRIFINGALISSGSIGGNPRYRNDSIGLGNFNVEYHSQVDSFNGSIDEFQIFNRIFSKGDVKGLNDFIFISGFE